MSEQRFPWRTLLFVSLAFNLLVIGAAAGAFGAGVRLERQSPQAIVDRMPGQRAFMAALPPATRAKVRTELVHSMTQSRELRAQASQARRDAFAAAATEPYDVERVRAAFARLRAADQAAIGVFHDNIATAFATLTPAERAEALQALRAAPPVRRQAVAPGRRLDRAQLPPSPERRAARREHWREVMRERREQRQQGQPPASPPAP